MGKRILITAGASGIGREIAKAFSEIGDKIFVCDINEGTEDVCRRNARSNNHSMQHSQPK